MSPWPCCLSRDHRTRLCVWEPSAVGRRSYSEPTSLLATVCTPERQSLCESHRQRRWLTHWRYRDVEELMRERGISVDHTTGFRWMQRYAPERDKRCRP